MVVKMHFGWAIWQSNHLCEAEHHAVWEDDKGNLLDITPRVRQFDTIMFVPDNETVFTGTRIPNFRVNGTNNPVIDDLIKIFNVRDWMGTYGRQIDREKYGIPQIVCDYINDEVVPPGVIPIMAGCTEYFYLIGGELNSDCFCSFSKSYRDCHQKLHKYTLNKCKVDVEEKLGKPE
jgi:hypothetical protein